MAVCKKIGNVADVLSHCDTTFQPKGSGASRGKDFMTGGL